MHEPVDYSELTLAELEEVARQIDRDRVPERAAAVQFELARKKRLVGTSPLDLGPFVFEIKRYRRYQWLAIASWAAFVPAEMLVGNLLAGRLHSAIPSVVVAVVILACFLYAGIRIRLFRCPRCNKQFSVRSVA